MDCCYEKGGVKIRNPNLPAFNQFKGKKFGDYELIEEIGDGNVGVVYKAYRKDIDHYRAIKIIPDKKLKPNWQLEIMKVVKLVDIPQVTQYYDHKAEQVFDGNTYACISWEYINGDNLKDYVKKNLKAITIEFVSIISDQLLQAFLAMKDQKISHNDLHEGNILIYFDKRKINPHIPRIKITDFGIGGSHNELKPKDDYKELARILRNLLELIDPSDLSDGRTLFFYDKFIEFIQKKILEKILLKVLLFKILRNY